MLEREDGHLELAALAGYDQRHLAPVELTLLAGRMLAPPCSMTLHILVVFACLDVLIIHVSSLTS